MTAYPGVVLGVPYTPPPPPRDPWTGARMYMWDQLGRRWDLSGNRASGVRMQSGVRGLGTPRYARHTTPYAALPGSRYRGSRALDREVFWPLWVWNDGGDQDWLKYDSEFWSTMDPTQPVTWEVVQPDGTSRFLDVRYDNDNDVVFDRAPGMRAWQPYGIYLVAEQPHWRGAPVQGEWAADAAVQPFFGGVGDPGGPPFYISSDAVLSNASVTNPGDVPAWPMYRGVGPLADLSVTLRGSTLGWTQDLVAGDILEIYTDPARQGAFLNGERVTSQVSPRQYASIPPRSTVPLEIAVTGTGKLQMEFEPLFRRAW